MLVDVVWVNVEVVDIEVDVGTDNGFQDDDCQAETVRLTIRSHD